MSAEIIVGIILLGIGLSMDAFAASITDGLVMTDIKKKNYFFIAGVFGVMQALMPLIGFWLVELVTVIVGQTGGEQAGHIMSEIVAWIAFALLLFIGGKMIFEAIIDLKKPEEEKQPKKFRVKDVLIMGVATSIDALAAGVSIHTYPNETTYVWLHVCIIMTITFCISLLGLFFGKFIVKLLKGKFEITSIIGGAILVALGIWVVCSHYLGI